MKRMIYVLALSLLAVQAKAQTGAAQAVRYDEASNQVVELKPQSELPTVQLAPTPTVIINNNGASATSGPTASSSAPTTASSATTAQSLGIVTQIQEQPVTVVEEKPMSDSRAEQLRKARGEMEGHTEQTIVEKLEESRIEGEKHRSERFDSALSSQPAPFMTPAPVAGPVVAAPAVIQTVEIVKAKDSVVAPDAQAVLVPVQAPVVVQAVPQPVQSAPVVVVPNKEDHSAPLVETFDGNRSELSSPDARPEYKVKEKKYGDKADGPHAYVGADAGIINYSGASNLKANGAGGFSVGYVTANRLVFEGGFLYSNFNIQQNGYYSSGQYPPYENLNQYNMTLALKYQLLPGAFRPFVGVVASYTYRTYSSPNSYNYNYNSADPTTNAIDVGLTAGLDFQITPNFAIGVDFRYMTNMTNQTDAAYQQSVQYSGYSQSSSIEEMDYYSALVTGKFLF